MLLETSNPEFDTIIETLVPKYEKVNVTVVYSDGSKDKRRLGRAFDHVVMMYRKRSKRYGYYLEKRHFASIIFPEKKATRATQESKWLRSWANVLKRLQASGLWEEVAKDVENALAIGLDKIKQAYSIDNEYNHNSPLGYQEEKRLQAERVKALDERLIGYRDDGTCYIDTNIVWYMYKPAKVKKMHFGRKYLNDGKLAEIAECLKNKQKTMVYTDGRFTNGYDVHFEYNPEANKAWYSEEYRGCGNGHYYLALDATHALFYEDD